MRVRSPAAQGGGASGKRKARSLFDTFLYTSLVVIFLTLLALIGLLGERFIAESTQKPSKVALVSSTQAQPLQQQQLQAPSHPPSPPPSQPPSLLRGGAVATAAAVIVPPSPRPAPVQAATTMPVSNSPPVGKGRGKDKDKEAEGKRQNGKKKQPPPTQPPVDYGPNIYPLVSHMTWKTGPRQDLRIDLPRIVDTGSVSEQAARRLRHNFSATGVATTSTVDARARNVQDARDVLSRHPLWQPEYVALQNAALAATQRPPDLPAVIEYLGRRPECRQHPVMLSMATVGDDLYAALIETFVYSMVKFNVSDCTLVICVSDPKCLKLCADNRFPCYDYRSLQSPLPSVMEQIGEVKLLHVGKALAKGVDVFMLDLDVGFLASPKGGRVGTTGHPSPRAASSLASRFIPLPDVIRMFYDTPKIDIFVQEDFIFIMNRRMWLKEGVKTWFTDMLPNIGLFLCRGNDKVVKVFEHAWVKVRDWPAWTPPPRGPACSHPGTSKRPPTTLKSTKKWKTTSKRRTPERTRTTC